MRIWLAALFLVALPMNAADMNDSIAKLRTELTAKYGASAQPRLDRGLKQVAQFWRAEDGDAATFEQFVRDNFAGDQAALDLTFERLQKNLEQYDGHMLEIVRVFREPSDLDIGPTLAVDDIFGGYDPSAHANDDFFSNKLAFVVLLNFPLTTLEERLKNGETWTRRQWAEVRLAQRFSRRVPADVNMEISKRFAEGEKYIAGYNIWMHHVLTDDGKRLFPAKLRLLSHWNLRDEIKAEYSEKGALPKQRMIQQVMERIVTQTIPAAVVDNPTVDWKPYANTVTAAAVSDSDAKPLPNDQVTNAPEPNTRYERLLNNFKANKLADPYSPTAPTFIARSFEEQREIPEARVKETFEQILTAPVVPKIAKLIEKRLGRKLEPFDIWYNGFRPRGQYTEDQLDAITKKKYPTAEAYKADIPNLLQGLGFSKERAEYVASNIVVDPARGSGHAWGAARREDKAHLRTRVEADGMNYKGYNIAVHEMGHNVEQTFSLDDIDYPLLAGVPNNAFTEALAFVFQGHDLELLGLSKASDETRALAALNSFWGAYEIAGVGLVDIGVWHWMYDHPDATPAQLRDATVEIAKDVWNRDYAPVFGRKDVVLLGVYSHMIERQLYLPDYTIGQMIASQVEAKMDESGAIGPEFERVAKIGRVAPDVWMKQATGAPVGPEAMIAQAEKALAFVK